MNLDGSEKTAVFSFFLPKKNAGISPACVLPASARNRVGAWNIEFFHIIQTYAAKRASEDTAAVDVKDGVIFAVDDFALVFRSVKEGGGVSYD